MPKRDLYAIPQTNLTGYPPPIGADVEGRWYCHLAPGGEPAKMGGAILR